MTTTRPPAHIARIITKFERLSSPVLLLGVTEDDTERGEAEGDTASVGARQNKSDNQYNI